uniref:cytochrome c oxidase subunit II n=1 Tax=Halorussus ruber TaxID=1126238 RepID=UPI001091DFEB|nr:cytochrome c oxidase subunit II [Halorussus ruber]
MVAWTVLGLLVGLATPAAAQSVNRNLIDQLNTQLLYVALPLTLFVEVILVYAVVRFRDNENPEPTAEDPALEITWTVATGIVLVFVGVAAYTVLTSPFITPTPEAEESRVENDVTVDALAYQWEFEYEEASLTTQDLLVVPRDRNVSLELRSADVLHSMYVPELGLKQDVFPGNDTIIKTRVLQTGEYRGYCAEFCGAGHARMRTRVVVPPDTYRQWLADHEGERDVTAPPNGTAVGSNGTAVESNGAGVSPNRTVDSAVSTAEN